MKRRRKQPTVRVRPPFKRGDVVYVISGDDKGRTGKVLRVMPDEGRAVVEGINLVKRHRRRSQEHPQGIIATVEAPVPLCKLRRHDPARKRPAGAK